LHPGFPGVVIPGLRGRPAAPQVNAAGAAIIADGEIFADEAGQFLIFGDGGPECRFELRARHPGRDRHGDEHRHRRGEGGGSRAEHQRGKKDTHRRSPLTICSDPTLGAKPATAPRSFAQIGIAFLQRLGFDMAWISMKS
jgi:hypothetical protein